MQLLRTCGRQASVRTTTCLAEYLLILSNSYGRRDNVIRFLISIRNVVEECAT